MFLESEVPGWLTTDKSQGVKLIEIWDYKQGYPGVVKDFPTPPDGNRYAEINAGENGMLYQDVKTTPGQTIYWRFSHKGREGIDKMQLRIGPSTNNPYDTVVQQQMSDGNTAWGTYTGTYKVPEGQTVTRFGFEAVSTSNGSMGYGNHIDDIFLGTEPCLSATKSVDPEGQVQTGDELTYNVTVKNNGGDVAANSIFTDAIPEGTEYVPGSIQVTKNAQVSKITDDKDTDSGYYQDGKVTVDLGDVPNTDILPEGITVQFKVKVLPGYINQQIKNKAQVAYKNLLTNRDGLVETNEVVNDVVAKAAKVESQKTAKNLQDKPIEVGDEIEYTIQTRNTISDSIVKNVVMEDQLPEGLEYVPGTLHVDGTAVTDAEGDDNGQYVQGKVTGKLGDITDTEWHTVVFHAKVKDGQAGKNIQNTANVTGDGITPQEPTTEITVQALGQIEIEKVDAADSNVKLKNAVFQILDKDGKEVGKLTTDENGKATSDPLRFGTYTLKEIQAPTGYMLLKDPVEVKVSSPVQKIKVENTKNGWDIPNTGGIGTTLFYLIGTLLMVATLIVFFRKRRNI
uniref:SpaA isopeptide-forming pilin-related protein n=1 Tax=Bacillus bingmayongensis TaxID=1150157 RepID=UPI0035AB7E23